MSSAARPARSKRPSTSPIASFSSTTWSALRLLSRDCALVDACATRGSAGTPRRRRHLEAAPGQLLLQVADAFGRLLEPLLLAVVQAPEDRARAEVAGGDRGQHLRIREAAGHPPLHRADVVQQPSGDEILELLRARHVGGQLVEGAHDRRRRRRVQTRPDRRGRCGLEELLHVGPGTRGAGLRAGLPGGDHGGEEVDLVHHVFVHVGLREVEAQEMERDLLVLGLHLLEESPHVRRRDVAVGLAKLFRERVEAIGELANPGRDFLGRDRVDRSGDRTDVVVELAEVQGIARLGGEERLLDSTQKLVERPERLEPFGQANVVFVKKLDSLDGHRFSAVPIILAQEGHPA